MLYVKVFGGEYVKEDECVLVVGGCEERKKGGKC